MFDSSAEIAFPAALASTGGVEQEVVVRWPTDKEWSTRAKARKVIQRRHGRGVTETVPPPPGEADTTLYQAIALNGSPAMTPAEAAKLFEKLGAADVFDVQMEGDELIVEMNVMNSSVKHRLRAPMADQVFEWRRGAFRVLDLPFNQQQIVTTPDAGARLYDQCGGHSDDYVNGIPALHKDAVVRAAIEFTEGKFGPRQDDQNF